MRGVVRPGLTIKAALVLGFGLTLALWVFTGYQFARAMAHLEGESSAVASTYAQSQELLSSIRAQVLSTTGLVRDAILETNRPSSDHVRQVEDSIAELQNQLDGYRPVLNSEAERQAVAAVYQEMRVFGDSMRSVVLQAAVRATTSDARAVINAAIVPRREAVLRASERLQSVNRAAFIKYQADLDVVHISTERQTWRRLGWALAFSLGIAILATLYAGRLERRLVTQLETNEQTRRTLQQLGAKLINVQEDERHRIARELHDEVGQALTAIKVELAVAQRAIESTITGTSLLDAAQSITDGALQTVRDLSHLLRPPVLDDLGLAAAVDWYLRDFWRRCGIKGELTQHHMGIRLAPDVEVAAYRIIQEALTNVARHAKATSCSVTLGYHQGMLGIVIEDDGVGIDQAAMDVTSERRGMGLLGMRERAGQFGGSVVVARALPHGTRVTIQLSATRQHVTEDDSSVSSRLPRFEPIDG